MVAALTRTNPLHEQNMRIVMMEACMALGRWDDTLAQLLALTERAPGRRRAAPPSVPLPQAAAPIPTYSPFPISRRRYPARTARTEAKIPYKPVGRRWDDTLAQLLALDCANMSERHVLGACVTLFELHRKS